MQKYTAVFPTKSLKNLEQTTKSLIENSKKIREVIVIWDGSKKEFLTIPHLETQTISFKCIQNAGLDVYGMFNYAVSISESDYVLLVNDDMYFPLDWDINVDMRSDTVVTFLVVEPGYVKIDKKNIENNFGLTWEEFKKEAFEKFVLTCQREMIRSGELGWYMPVIFPKSLFLEAGKYPVKPAFPYPNDVIFFENLKAKPKVKFVQVMSPVYHFQRLSQRNLSLQQKILKKIGFK